MGVCHHRCKCGFSCLRSRVHGDSDVAVGAGGGKAKGAASRRLFRTHALSVWNRKTTCRPPTIPSGKNLPEKSNRSCQPRAPTQLRRLTRCGQAWQDVNAATVDSPAHFLLLGQQESRVPFK
jgi:hypothetical protein